VRITALQDGKALENVRLLFYLRKVAGDPKLALTTDKQGVVLATDLAPGRYRILAIGPTYESAEVYLDISEKAGTQTNSFLISIPPTFLPETVSAIDAAPITEHVREFKGHVADPSGAFVPGALVQVFRQGAPSAESVARIKADSDGVFSASLAPGKYVVFISSPGFFKKIVGFAIGPEGEAKDFRVEMRIGFC